MDLFTESSCNTKMEPHLDIVMDDFIVSTLYKAYFYYLHKIASDIFEYTNKQTSKQEFKK